MKLYDDIYLIGSGEIRLSDRLDSHIYLLGDKEGAIMIDAGCGMGTDKILSNIKHDGFDPLDVKYLFLTHCHSDHAIGGSEIRSKTSCEVLTSVQEAPFIERGTDQELGLDVCKKADWYPPDLQYKHCKVDRSLRDNEIIDFGKYKIRSIILSGHSYGVLCLLVEFNKKIAFFSSDVIFLGGTIGLGNWPGSSLQSYREHIGKVKGLDVDLLFPGHSLWTLEGGQMHLDKAVDNLSYGWVPPIGGHKHPVY